MPTTKTVEPIPKGSKSNMKYRKARLQKISLHLMYYKDNCVLIHNAEDTNDGVIVHKQVGHFGGRQMDNIALAPFYIDAAKNIRWKQKVKNREGWKQKEFHIVSFPKEKALEVARAILKIAGEEGVELEPSKEDIEYFGDNNWDNDDFLPV